MLIATLVALIGGLIYSGSGDERFTEVWETRIERVQDTVEDEERRGEAVTALRATGAAIGGRRAFLVDNEARLIEVASRHDVTEEELLALFGEIEVSETIFWETVIPQQIELRRAMTREEWQAAFSDDPDEQGEGD